MIRSYICLVISIALLFIGNYAINVEPSLEGHTYGLIDMYEGAMCLATSVGFALASRK